MRKIAILMLVVSVGAAAQDAALRKKIVDMALGFQGVPYVYGAESPAAFDCSGLVHYVYKKAANLDIPRNSRDQHAIGIPIEKDAAQVGDVYVFNTSGSGPSHVAICLGDGTMIHAISEGPKTGVVISKLTDRYFGPRLIAARSFFPVAASAAPAVAAAAPAKPAASTAAPAASAAPATTSAAPATASAAPAAAQAAPTAPTKPTTTPAATSTTSAAPAAVQAAPTAPAKPAASPAAPATTAASAAPAKPTASQAAPAAAAPAVSPAAPSAAPAAATTAPPAAAPAAAPAQAPAQVMTLPVQDLVALSRKPAIEPIGFTVTPEPTVYNDKIPTAIGTSLAFTITNGTGKDGIFDIYFYKANIDFHKTEILRHVRTKLAKGQAQELEPYLFTEPGTYRLNVKSGDNDQLLQRVFRVVETPK